MSSGEASHDPPPVQLSNSVRNPADPDYRFHFLTIAPFPSFRLFLSWRHFKQAGRHATLR